jgi:serine/threonine protein phosphatase PrpC
MTVAVAENGRATIGHVGDSRLYKIRRGEIRKITHDHSPVGEREDRGEISEAEAMRHPRRNEVYRDVGSQEHAPDDPDFIEAAEHPVSSRIARCCCAAMD